MGTVFFGSWWQAIVFGLVTTIAIAAMCYAFTIKWGKFMGETAESSSEADAHHSSH